MIAYALVSIAGRDKILSGFGAAGNAHAGVDVASAVAIIRNAAFAGFVIGAAMLAAPLVSSPAERTRLVAKIWRPPSPFVTPLPTPTAGPASVESAARAAPRGRLDHKTAALADIESDPPTDNLAWLNEQAARNKARQIGSTEFGPDQPQAERYEKTLFDQKTPSSIQPGTDGTVQEAVVFRDGADITSTIMGVIPAGTRVHIVAIGDLNYVLAEFETGGTARRKYIYGGAIKPLGGGQ